MYIAAEAAKTKGLPVKGASVVIQGFGNVGGNAARLMASELGTNIVGLSDSHGGIYNQRRTRYLKGGSIQAGDRFPEGLSGGQGTSGTMS